MKEDELNIFTGCDGAVVLLLDSDRLQTYKLFINKPQIPPGNRRFTILPYQNPKTERKKITLYKAIPGALLSKKTLKRIENKPLVLRASISRLDYLKKIQILQHNIQAGNIYEINYCIEFYAENVSIDPVSVFIKLHELSKAPYAQLVKNGHDYIISASPELFLKKEGNVLSTKPIKGTVRRGKNDKEDNRLKEELKNSIKERTENVMAVDVARNDLSRLATRGSVIVNKLCNIETFETVHQMVSTVSCELKPGVSFTEIVDATFPMASMTGAPKIKAMELIDAMEDFKRHYYSGAMGFIDENGDFELSVNIRSIFYNEQTKRLSIAVGSAVTHLCDPIQEYEECLLKANALLKALNATIKEL